ncbi:class I SAM-dependent methyltransferase [Sulfurimonas sp. HSL-1716]|uniref:class I SAM-dependent methyltransferase n=1 Tax=Hydrocurvibacter sulfurireducens TaxID=3131937 RepID=UPI0031F9FD9A
MLEQSKAARRRFYNGNFHNRYFNGEGIDIGGKPDPFSQYIGVFPLVRSVKIWDLEDGDAQKMQNCEDESFDFVVSSHCLEHMVDVYEAFQNWLRITKKGGYLIITVPDEDMYEQKQWPSVYNTDHKHTFTIQKSQSWSEHSINIFDLLRKFQDHIEIEKVEKISEFYNHNLYRADQTLQPNVESAIEFIVRKKSDLQIIEIQKERSHLEPKIEDRFPNEFSELLTGIQKLKNQNSRFVVYGYGNLGRMLDDLLGDKIVGFVDGISDLTDTHSKRDVVYSVKNLQNMEFDHIIITLLGREEQIVQELCKTYHLDNDKIILLR